MPVYLYRREDGTTFEYKQRFLDDPLTVDPETGQKVVRVIQPTGVIFKGSGFYVNDSKNASKSNLNSKTAKTDDSGTETETKSETKTDTESKSETKSESKTDAESKSKSEKKSDKKAS